MDKPQRSDYLAHTVTHEDFYRSVYQTAGIRFDYPEDRLTVEAKLALDAGDEHLNSIPLARWDRLAESAKAQLSRSFKEHGDFYTLAGGVCAMKQAVKDAVAKAGAR